MFKVTCYHNSRIALLSTEIGETNNIREASTCDAASLGLKPQEIYGTLISNENCRDSSVGRAGD